MKTSYSGKGFIRQKYKAPDSLYEYIWSLTKNIKKHLPNKTNHKDQRLKYHHFLSHLYASMAYQYLKKSGDTEGDYSLPISSRLIEKEFKRDFNVQILVDKKLILLEQHSHNLPGQKNKSRQFKLTNAVFKKANRLESKFVLDAWKKMVETGKYKFKTVNLMTGRPMVTKEKQKLTKQKETFKTNMPKLIKDSIKSIVPCPFNPKEVYNLVVAEQRKYLLTNTQLKKAKEEYGEDSQEYLLSKAAKNTAFGRYLNDLTALKTILYQQPEPSTTTPGLYTYQAAYTAQVSGRLNEVHGGFLSASKVFKKLFLKGVPNIFNYDMKNAQAEILLEEFKKAGLNCAWLNRYLNNSQAKQVYADKVGIPVELWKEFFFAIVMGVMYTVKKGSFT